MQLEEGENAIFRRSKRRDRNGDSIKPRPIFNSRESGHYFWYFYEFTPEDRFPDPNKVDFTSVCTESRKHINLEDIIWDITKSFRMMGVQLNPQLTAGLRQEHGKLGGVKETLLDTGKYKVLNQMMRQVFGEHYEEEYGITEDTTIAEYVGFVNMQEIDEAQKEVLLSVLG